MTTKGLHTGGSNYNDENDYDTPPPVSVATAALSDSELAIPFGFGSQGSMATAIGYTKLSSVVLSWGYLLFLLGQSSLSYYTDDATNEDMVDLGAA